MARVPIGIKTSPQDVDWPTLDAAWGRIGEHDVFDSVWLNDHLTDIGRERAGASLESLTAIKRAGADVIVTYWARELAQWL